MLTHRHDKFPTSTGLPQHGSLSLTLIHCGMATAGSAMMVCTFFALHPSCINRITAASRSMYSSTAAPPVPPSLDLKPCLPHGVLRPRRCRIQRVHLRAAVRVSAADRGDVGPHRMPLCRGYGAPRLRAAERASLHPCRPPLWRIAASGRRIHRQMSAANEA